MEFRKLESPIPADWYRALILESFDYMGSTLEVIDEEEESWEIKFETIQAVKSVTEECFHLDIPSGGALFEVVNSPWIKELGLGTIDFLDKSKHYVICCYDEIIEVVAWDCKFRKIDSP